MNKLNANAIYFLIYIAIRPKINFRKKNATTPHFLSKIEDLTLNLRSKNCISTAGESS